MSNGTKDLEELVDDALRQGWKQRKTTEGHTQLFAPNGKGIVVFAGTPSDHRSFDNSLAEMKQHGYRPPDDRGQLLAKRHSMGVKKAVVEYLSAHPDPIDTTSLKVIVTARLKETPNNNAVAAAIANLFKAGQVVRLARGYYQWKGEPAKLTVQVRSGSVAVQPFDPDTIDDERELDEALATLGRIETELNQALDHVKVKVGQALEALGRIEGVVRKHRGISKQLDDLRRVLGAPGTKREGGGP